MFYYFYDTFLNHKKYEKILAKIETRTTDLGIGGKKRRMDILKNMAELVKEVIDKGAETIVAVGNDETFTQMVNIVASSNITLGYIPLTRPNKIAKALGIPLGELACEVLSNRLVETIDLGKVNHSYFFSSLETKGQIVLSFGKCRITPLENQKVNIYNFAPHLFKKNGILETVISSPSIFLGTIRDSFFPVKKIKIDSQIKKEPIVVTVDQNRILKTPLLVEVLPKKLKMIVGRERKF
jgi:diacylglycerol kinase family enzyme